MANFDIAGMVQLPPQQRTLQDVWKQPTLGELMQVHQIAETQKTRQEINKLEYMQAHQGNEQMDYKNKRQQAMKTGNQQEIDRVDAMYPYLAAEYQTTLQTQQYAQQKQKSDTMKSAADALLSLKKSFGVQAIKSNWDNLKGLNPVFAKLDPNNITEQGYEVKDPKTGEAIGQWIQNPETGDLKFVKGGGEDKNLTVYQSAKKSLIQSGNAKPTEDQVWAKVGEFEQKKQASADDFENWDPMSKEMAYRDYLIDPQKNRPLFGGGTKGQQAYKQFTKGFYEWRIKEAINTGDVATLRSSRSGLEKSIDQQTKNQGMMGSYIKNMAAQETRLNEILNDITRIDARILNVPYREWKTKFKGTVNENKLNMYSTEISNEATRLSSGNAQSIAQLPEGARDHWETKIHDINLTVPDLRELYHETVHAGQIRYQSVNDQLKESQGLLQGLVSKVGGGKASPKPAEINNNPYNVKFNNQAGASKGTTATDGGNFASFKSAAEGEKAARDLLFGQAYKNMTVDAAMKKWSNNGYGGEILPTAKGKKISELTITERENLLKAMKKAEGSQDIAKEGGGTEQKKRALPDGWTKATWKAKAKEANPGVTEAQLEAEYKKRYGG